MATFAQQYKAEGRAEGKMRRAKLLSLLSNSFPWSYKCLNFLSS